MALISEPYPFSLPMLLSYLLRYMILNKKISFTIYLRIVNELDSRLYPIRFMARESKSNRNKILITS